MVFVDYPGEWLVDVPMVGLSYSRWSQDAWNRLQAKPWSEISDDFRKLIASTDWAHADDNEIARRAAVAWQDVLVAARARGLKWLQPGHFVRARGHADDGAVPRLDEERLWFCPLPEAVISSAKPKSLANAMAERYARYQKRTEEFFRGTLKDATHHVVLVDVLEALAEGERPFHESAEVLAEVYRVFVTETSGVWSFLGKAGLRRLLLVATKADSVPPNQRAAMRSLLSAMCARRLAGSASTQRPETENMAAIRATEDVETVVDGNEPVRVVEGLCADTGKRRRVTMIDVPDQMPEPDYFRRREGVRPPRFVPPRVPGSGDYGIPNLRLGYVLNKLFGEALR